MEEDLNDYKLIWYFSECTTFSILLIYILELFPTCVRNSTVAMVRQVMVLGGALSTMLIAVGRNNEWLSFGVFGLIIATCGCFVVFLPETKRRTLGDTMDGKENKDTTFVC